MTLFALGIMSGACAAPGRGGSDDDDDGSSSQSGIFVGVGGGNSGSGGSGANNASSANNSSSASGMAQNDLYPMGVGYVWTYDVFQVGGGSVCPSGLHDAEVIGETTIDGLQAYEVTSWCSGVGGTSHLAKGEGEETLFYYDGAWLPVIAEPVEQGYSWDYFNTSYTWQYAGTVHVPAGTFEDCWTAQQNVSYTAFQTYCPGVGMVQSFSADLNGAGWDAQLTSTNF